MPRRTVADNVSERVRAYLQANALTQEAFAAQVGRSQSAVSRWIKGDSTWPAHELLFLAQSLGVPVTAFYEGVAPDGAPAREASGSAA